ncbi:hypothetical protein C3K47_07955 [Solitalea longa]|uniref:Recombinase n=1 Tax=Solitalea longa TaxID=2079460 RepID=A0A2S5A368_9SPHI|nr:site-specific integrase [Solitalea longa]POY36986.1 hypothetical protein C3K47_07955 [Solitalea longa]
MATLKLFLNTQKRNKQDEAPLYLRIIKDRRSKYISTGIYIKEKDWDNKNRRVKKSHPNSVRINHVIANKLLEAEGQIMEIQLKDKYADTNTIKRILTGQDDLMFNQFSDYYKKSVEHKYKIATLNKLDTAIKRIKEFNDNNDLYFHEINVAWLRSFESFLRTDCKNGTNTIHTTLKHLRRIINQAIQEELYPLEKNPFLRYKLKWEKTKQEYLTMEELKKIEDLALIPGSKKATHRDIFVFSAYVGGLRISDILQLKWENYTGDKIIIQTHKTSSLVSIKMPNKALQILHKYHRPNIEKEQFIFPILNQKEDYTDRLVLHSAISSATAYANKDLKLLGESADIDKKLHFHMARHTFATMALMKGMRIEYVSKLMGHSNITTTQIYAKIVNEELDKAMEVFN